MNVFQQYAKQVNTALVIVPRKLSIFVGLCFATSMLAGVVWFRSVWATLGLLVLCAVVCLVVTFLYMKYQFKKDPVGTMFTLLEAQKLFSGTEDTGDSIDVSTK